RSATVVATSVSPPLMRSLRRARTPSRLPSPSSGYTPSTPYSAPGRSSCTTTASRPFELALPSPPFADFADSDTASPRSAAEAKQRPVEPLPKRGLTMNRPFGFAARTLTTSLPSHVAGEGRPRCVSAEAMRCLSKTMVCAPDSRAATMHPVLRSSAADPDVGGRDEYASVCTAARRGGFAVFGCDDFAGKSLSADSGSETFVAVGAVARGGYDDLKTVGLCHRDAFAGSGRR